MRPYIKISQWHTWQGPETTARVNGRFRGKNGAIPLAKTIQDLEYELEKLDVTDAEVAFGLDGKSFAKRGWPLVNAPGHPGVVLTYTHPKHGVMRIATDRFFDWDDNLRAIAITLENLRQMDRYGTTGDGKQYEGFRALPATTDSTLSAEKAAEIIKEAGQLKYASNLLLMDRELASIGVRAALFQSHPDRNPGKPDAHDYFHRVEQARQALSAHHGGGL